MKISPHVSIYSFPIRCDHFYIKSYYRYRLDRNVYWQVLAKLADMI